MLGSKFKSLLADRDGAPALIHRLLTEQAFGQWRRYAVAFALMAVAAGATSLSAYLAGNAVNAAYVDGHVETRPRSIIEWQWAGVDTAYY